MGQQNSYLNVSRTTGALDSFIADLGADIVYEKRSFGNPLIPSIRTSLILYLSA